MAQFTDSSAFGILEEAKAVNGYAYPNRYEVLITGPSKPGPTAGTNVFSGAQKKSDSRSISLRCETVTLPGRNLATAQDTNIYGPTREIVEGVTFAEDISMTFQASSDLKERVFFENWQRQAFNEKSWDVGYYEEYVGVVEIYLLDRQDKRTYGLKLHEVFPKTIGGTELSYGTNNEIVKITIGFSFRYWTNVDLDQSSNISLVDPDEFGAVEKSIARNQPKIVDVSLTP